MGGKRETRSAGLLRDIESLLQPGVVEDPEDEGLDAADHIADDDDVDAGADGANAPRARLERGIARDISLADGAYRGSVASRASVFGGASSSASESDGDASDDDDDEAHFQSSDSDNDSDNDSDDDGSGSARVPRRKAEVSSDELDEEDDEFGAASTPHIDGGDTGTALDTLEAMEEDELMNDVKILEDNQDELRKAQHAKVQKSIGNALMDFRIRLHRIQTGVLRLPASRDLRRVKAGKRRLVSSKLFSMLRGLCEIREKMSRQNGAKNLSSSAESILETLDTSYKASSDNNDDDRWNAFGSMWDQYREEAMNVLEKWRNKSAKSIVEAGKGLQALNQSIHHQFEHIMRDKQTLVERSRTLRSDVQIINLRSGKHKEQNTDESSQFVRQDRNRDAKPNEMEHDDVYDDTDFYQAQLKEVIGSAGSFSTSELADRLRSVKTHRRGVDRRASKGRKLSYEVQDKLVAFMAPQEHHEPSAARIDLFSI